MSFKHLLHIDDLTLHDVNALFETAHALKHGALSPPSLPSQTTALCFWENSTRTRASFEIAAQKLGLHSMYLHAKQSSSEKGESDLDTFLTLQSLGVKCFVVRHHQDQFYQAIVPNLAADSHMINAGDGSSGHPTQALLDVFTLKQHKKEIAGLNVLFVGDLHHSRVVQSNVRLLTKMGAECSGYVPEHLSLLEKDSFLPNLKLETDLDSAMAKADAIMLLRAQDERWSRKIKSPTYSYLQEYGLNQKRLKQLNPKTLIMHPGPFRRGVELCDEVLQDKRCLIWQQVENGLFMRMAIFNALLSGDKT